MPASLSVGSTRTSAAGPPVELAITTTPQPRRHAACGRAQRAARHRRRPSDGRARRGRLSPSTLAPRGRQELPHQLVAHVGQVGADLAVRLFTKSTAPAASASTVSAAPALRVRAEHDDRHRPLGEDRPRGLGAVQTRHVEVHRDHVGRELGGEPHGFEAVLRLAAHLEVRVGVQQARHGATHERGVVDDQDPERRLSPAALVLNLTTSVAPTSGASGTPT